LFCVKAQDTAGCYIDVRAYAGFFQQPANPRIGLETYTRSGTFGIQAGFQKAGDHFHCGADLGYYYYTSTDYQYIPVHWHPSASYSEQISLGHKVCYTALYGGVKGRIIGLNIGTRFNWETEDQIRYNNSGDPYGVTATDHYFSFYSILDLFIPKTNASLFASFTFTRHKNYRYNTYYPYGLHHIDREPYMFVNFGIHKAIRLKAKRKHAS
jgi:hypothetical protein